MDNVDIGAQGCTTLPPLKKSCTQLGESGAKTHKKTTLSWVNQSLIKSPPKRKLEAFPFLVVDPAGFFFNDFCFVLSCFCFFCFLAAATRTGRRLKVFSKIINIHNTREEKTASKLPGYQQSWHSNKRDHIAWIHSSCTTVWKEMHSKNYIVWFTYMLQLLHTCSFI